MNRLLSLYISIMMMITFCLCTSSQENIPKTSSKIINSNLIINPIIKDYTINLDPANYELKSYKLKEETKLNKKNTKLNIAKSIIKTGTFIMIIAAGVIIYKSISKKDLSLKMETLPISKDKITIKHPPTFYDENPASKLILSTEQICAQQCYIEQLEKEFVEKVIKEKNTQNNNDF